MATVRQRRVIEVQLLADGGLKSSATLIGELIKDKDSITTSAAESVVRFSTDQDEQGLADILAKLTASGQRVSQFREVPMDLEDAFMSVTKEAEASAPEETSS